MANTKEIRIKISSIKNTQKITSAMEKVATSKMRGSQKQMLSGRPYNKRIRQLISHIAQSRTDHKSGFMENREVKNIGYIVISSDRGLCGGLNSNLFRMLISDMKKFNSEGKNMQIVTFGSKASLFFKNYGGNVIASISNLGEKPNFNQIIGAVQAMIQSYNDKQIDAVYTVYNQFITTIVQKPVIEQLLPIKTDKKIRNFQWDYIYDTEPGKLLDSLINRYTESQIYHAILENIASEQSARMISMKNATDNAENIINDLNLIYNKVRQSVITQEISEIVGGASAV